MVGVFSETENARNYEEVILDTVNLLVPTIVLYEVFKKVLNDFDEDKALITIGHMKMGSVISIDEDDAVHAAKISVQNKMPMADSLIYSVALKYNATVYTQDDHFKNLKFVKYYPKK